MVVSLTADKLILDEYCLDATMPSPPGGGFGGCPDDSGGGDGDPSVAKTFLIPWFDSPGSQQTITLTLRRPFDSTAHYQLAVYPVTPQAWTLGEAFDSPASAAPYQVYTLEADPTLPFFVEIEDDAANGNFLWVAYQPYKPDDLWLRFPPRRISYRSGWTGRHCQARRSGIRLMNLYYLGGQTFRVLVSAADSYGLYGTPVELEPLDANEVLPVSVSYREPLRVLSLTTDQVSSANISFRLAEGAGALVVAYTDANPSGEGRSLGIGASGHDHFPLSATIDRATSSSGDGLLVAVQIPFDYSRDQVTVDIQWQPAP